jgi:hypothetical protein
MKAKTTIAQPKSTNKRTAEKLSIPPLPTPGQQARIDLDARARAQVVYAIAPDLAQACDELGEEIASIAASGSGDYANVADALLSVWKVRWELGLTPKRLAKLDESAQAEGGAS